VLLGAYIVASLLFFKPAFVLLVAVALALGSVELYQALRKQGMTAAVVPIVIGTAAISIGSYLAGVQTPEVFSTTSVLLASLALTVLGTIATYGLRGCEVRALRLGDIDWAHDEIVIFAPKTGRRRSLPLTRPVGEAVLDYLLRERPPSRHREVFPVQPAAAWPAAEQDQPLAGASIGQGRHRDLPPGRAYPAPHAGGPPATQRRNAEKHR